MKISAVLLCLFSLALCTLSLGQVEVPNSRNKTRADKVSQRSDTDAVNKALAWLEEWPPGTDDSTGWWAGGSAGERWNTFLAAQAFLAAGSSPIKGKYKDPLQRAFKLLQGDRLLGESDGGCSNWLLAMQAALLGDLLEAGVSQKYRSKIISQGERYAEFIRKYQIPRGGWGHHPFSEEEFEAEKTGAYPADLLCLTNLMAYALLSMGKSGVAIEGDILQKVISCYGLSLNDNGGIAYSSRNTGAEEPGRTAGTGYIFLRMLKDDSIGEKKSDVRAMHGRVTKYLDTRWGEVGHGHGNVATMHLWFGALYFYGEGDQKFEAFKVALFTEWLEEQAEDGSYSFRKKAGLSDFTVASEEGATSPALTALAAFVLQMHEGKAPCVQGLR